MSTDASVLVFDSGLGGLTVARAIRQLRPDLSLLYFADDKAFPYGAWDETDLMHHICAVVDRLSAGHDLRAAVIACNTASTIVLPALRARLRMPVVGTVPAIKPAAAASTSGLITVLGTPGTVTREYTFDLIRRFAPEAAINLVGARHLAMLAEEKLAGRPVDRHPLAEDVAACFVEKDGRRTDCIVLGCTHYPLLLEDIQKAAPWPVAYFDPAEAIARRLDEVVGNRPGQGALTALSSGPGNLADIALRYIREHSAD